MKFARVTLASAMAVVATTAFAADLGTLKSAPPAPANAPFFLFADTTVGYSFRPTTSEPGVGNGIKKSVFNITHVDAWSMGTNFFTMDILKSDHKDPSAGGGEGALEVYGIYRGTLSGNALTKSKSFSFGFVKDVSLAFGGDFNTKNTSFASEKRLAVGGVQVAFDVPGYFTVSALAGKEWGHCGICSGAGIDPEFNTNLHLEAAYMQPLSFTGLPLSFSGFANLVTPKGKDGFGAQTKTEILTQNRLNYDLSSMFGRKNFMTAYVGYQYWKNKFGNNYKTNVGAVERTVTIGLDWHVF